MAKSWRVPKARANEFLDIVFPAVAPVGKIPAGYYPGSEYKYKVRKPLGSRDSKNYYPGEYILTGHSKTKGYRFKKVK